MPSGNIQITVTVKRTSFLKRLARFPGVLQNHYSLFRKNLGVLQSLYASWLFASLIFKIH